MEHSSECRGKCPKCGSENLEYGSLELEDGDVIYYSFTCPDCKTTGKEWYSIEYTDTTY